MFRPLIVHAYGSVLLWKREMLSLISVPLPLLAHKIQAVSQNTKQNRKQIFKYLGNHLKKNYRILKLLFDNFLNDREQRKSK